jgi:hypothetical protein
MRLELKEDSEAQTYIAMLKRCISENAHCLRDEISFIPSSKVQRGSNHCLVLCSLINMCLLTQQQDMFAYAAGFLESVLADKETFFKLAINLTCYINYFVKEQIKEESRLQYLEPLTRCMVVASASILKALWLNLYGMRAEENEDLEKERELVPWLGSVYTMVDLISLNIKKASAKSLEDIPHSYMADFLVYICGLMTNDKTKEISTRWLRALYNVLEAPKRVLRHWVVHLEFAIDEGNKDQRRLLRISEPFANTFMKLLSIVFNTVRSLELGEVRAVNEELLEVLPREHRVYVPRLRREGELHPEGVRPGGVLPVPVRGDRDHAAEPEEPGRGREHQQAAARQLQACQTLVLEPARQRRAKQPAKEIGPTD